MRITDVDGGFIMSIHFKTKELQRILSLSYWRGVVDSNDLPLNVFSSISSSSHSVCRWFYCSCREPLKGRWPYSCSFKAVCKVLGKETEENNLMQQLSDACCNNYQMLSATIKGHQFVEAICCNKVKPCRMHC
nr:hypothetical protein [Tanacetum cinerariifolium]